MCWCWPRCRRCIGSPPSARLAAGVATVYGAIAAVDVIRLHWPAASALGYLNMAVWLIPGMFGIAYRRGLLTGRAALGTALALLAVNVALVHWGPYELSMVGTGDHHLSNTSPPSLLLAGTRNHLERVGNPGRASDRSLGAAAAGVVVDRDRQLRGDDPLPLAHARAPGRAPALRRRRVSPLPRSAGISS